MLVGMKLNKVHKVLKFNQSGWMKIYINFNTKTRKNVASGFEKNFFQLMINSIYGKIMESLRKKN